ncbi:YoaK family protein [uncultured Xylophilus sp.]|uniref:YoaK family protein n=1 Tax=uncultured Xylophilus sp. TaxID=296832 RepID=UPI0025FD1E96|nr:YoaK family protein [uncultured Xylophilus sp.]
MRRLLHIADRHRTPSTTRLMGYLLAFHAGAINAGGVLVVHMYTSHMTGFASQVADSLVLGRGTLLLGALGAILSFLAGAASTAVIVHWGRQHRLRSAYALPLILEAGLLLPFGLMGAITLTWSTPFAVPLTVLLLSFIMGLQNAVGSQASGGRIRTTHMTGNVTDLGIELGRLLYRNRSGLPSDERVQANRSRMRLYAGLLGMFVAGGLFGAAGFKHVGFLWVVPMAALLLTLALPPLLRDVRRSHHLQALLRRPWERLRAQRP